MNIFRIFSAAIAAIPLYGYFVHASRDTQLVGIFIILASFLTLIFMISNFVLFLAIYYRNKNSKWSGVLAIYFIIMGFVGYGGAQRAFYELLAG